MCPPESAIGFLDCMCDLDNFMKDIGGLFRDHTVTPLKPKMHCLRGLYS